MEKAMGWKDWKIDRYILPVFHNTSARSTLTIKFTLCFLLKRCLWGDTQTGSQETQCGYLPYTTNWTDFYRIQIFYSIKKKHARRMHSRRDGCLWFMVTLEPGGSGQTPCATFAVARRHNISSQCSLYVPGTTGDMGNKKNILNSFVLFSSTPNSVTLCFDLLLQGKKSCW